MKRFATTLLSALLFVATASADLITPPWAPTGMDFSLWSTYCANGNNFVDFSQKPTGYTNAASIWSYNEIAAEDAWLISPAIDLDAAKAYQLTFQYLTWDDASFYVDHFDVYASSTVPSSAETAATVVAETPIFSLSAITRTKPSWNQVDPIVNIKGDGATYILFHVSGRFWKRFAITAFDIKEYENIAFAPQAPSSLTATAAENQVLEVALSWTLPTHSTAGLPFSDDQTVSAVKVLRDDEEIVTLDGTATSFTDNAESGLTAGPHSYAVQACVADVWSELSEEAAVSYVGPVATQDIPWEASLSNMSDTDFNTFWVNYAGPNHGFYAGNWTNRPVGLFLINNYGYAQDTWLISAPLALEAGKSYQLEYALTLQAGSANVVVGLVDDTTPEEYSLIIENAASYTDDNNETREVTFKIPATRASAVDPRLALHDISTESHTVYLSYVKITEHAADAIESISQDANSRISVYDLSGRSLGTAQSAALAGYDKGVYILRVESAEGVKTLKIRK